MNAAAKRLIKVEPYKYSNGTFDRETLAGWSPFDFGKDEMPEAVRAAIMGAVPWPKTIAAAIEERAWWLQRDQELEAAWN